MTEGSQGNGWNEVSAVASPSTGGVVQGEGGAAFHAGGAGARGKAARGGAALHRPRSSSRASGSGRVAGGAGGLVPELVPIRYGRMLTSPFAFFRGGARIMAADLARTRFGTCVQLCGDAHLSNFGVFGSPERALVFDINDFDESARALGVGREAAGGELRGRRAGERLLGEGAPDGRADTVRCYREAMALRPYAQARASGTRACRSRRRSRSSRRRRSEAVKRAEAASRRRAPRTASRLGELTQIVDGQPRITATRR